MKCAAALLLLLLAPAVQADIFRPAYLEIREAVPAATGDPAYEVLWKVPAQGDLRLPGLVRLPAGTINLTEPQRMFIGGAYVERWRVSRPDGLVGQEVAIDGLNRGVSDVIVRLERLDGTSQMERLLPESPRFTVKAPTGTGEVAWSYLVLGVEHILGGVDHLLFVLALLLIVRGGKRILITITAFTVAHSITLVAATLGWLHVPGPPVEAMIALSIVFVAAEIIHGLRGRAGADRARPLGRRLQLRTAARVRIRGRPGRGRPAREGDSRRLTDLQRRRRARPIGFRSDRAGCPGIDCAFAAAEHGVDPLRTALCDWFGRHVLGH